MVDKPHVGPKGTPSSSPQPPETAQKPPKTFPQKGAVSAHPMTFLGMQFTGKEAQELWNVLIQTISRAIQDDQDRAVKAIKKLSPEHEDED